MSEKHAVLAKIETKWRDEGLSINAAASDEEIDRFCRRYGVGLPPPLLAYVSELNGLRANTYDGDFFRFWPLSEIQPVGDAWSGYRNLAAFQGVFLFADFSINAHGYGIRLDDVNTGAVVAVAGDKLIPVAGSLWSFFEMYLTDQNSLFPEG
jgi:hypothetical protein